MYLPWAANVQCGLGNDICLLYGLQHQALAHHYNVHSWHMLVNKQIEF